MVRMNFQIRGAVEEEKLSALIVSIARLVRHLTKKPGSKFRSGFLKSYPADAV
jgi:hypothetical protein